MRHPITGKRDRTGYNGRVHVSADSFRSLQHYCRARGISMRAALGQAIEIELDRIDGKDGMKGLCPVCGRIVGMFKSGRLQHHGRWADGGAEKCSGTMPLQKESISCVVSLASGRVFRCEIPLGLSDMEKDEIATALQNINDSLQSSIAKRVPKSS